MMSDAAVKNPNDEEWVTVREDRRVQAICEETNYFQIDPKEIRKHMVEMKCDHKQAVDYIIRKIRSTQEFEGGYWDTGNGGEIVEIVQIFEEDWDVDGNVDTLDSFDEVTDRIDEIGRIRQEAIDKCDKEMAKLKEEVSK